jgi:hypothetical protein
VVVYSGPNKPNQTLPRNSRPILTRTVICSVSADGRSRLNESHAVRQLKLKHCAGSARFRILDQELRDWQGSRRQDSTLERRRVPKVCVRAGRDRRTAQCGVLRSPEDMASAKPKELMRVALEREKWEDVIRRVREDGRRITSRVVTAFSVMRTRASDLHGQAQP